MTFSDRIAQNRRARIWAQKGARACWRAMQRMARREIDRGPEWWVPTYGLALLEGEARALAAGEIALQKARKNIEKFSMAEFLDLLGKGEAVLPFSETTVVAFWWAKFACQTRETSREGLPGFPQSAFLTADSVKDFGEHVIALAEEDEGQLAPDASVKEDGHRVVLCWKGTFTPGREMEVVFDFQREELILRWDSASGSRCRFFGAMGLEHLLLTHAESVRVLR